MSEVCKCGECPACICRDLKTCVKRGRVYQVKRHDPYKDLMDKRRDRKMQTPTLVVKVDKPTLEVNVNGNKSPATVHLTRVSAREIILSSSHVISDEAAKAAVIAANAFNSDGHKPGETFQGMIAQW